MRNGILQTISLLIVSFFIVGCAGKQMPKEDIVYKKVIEHNLKAPEAYEKTKMWLANTFVDSKSVIEYDNKENFTIIGNGIIPKINYMPMVSGDTRFTIKIQNKDNRARMILSNMQIKTWDSINGTLKYPLWSDKQFKTFSIEADSLANDLSEFLNNKKDSDNNW